MTPQPGDRYEHVPTGERYTFRDTWFSYARLKPDGDPARTRVVWLPDLKGKQWRREERKDA